MGIARTARDGVGLVAVGSGVGLVLATVLSSPWPLVAGLVLAGLGAATLFPTMLAAGDRVDGSGRGIAVASSAASASALLVPLVVGGLAEVASLRVGFAVLPVAALVAAVVLPRALRAPTGSS